MPINGSIATGSAPHVVRTTVACLVTTNLFELVPSLSATLLPLPAPPYKQAYEVTSAYLGGAKFDDLDLSRTRQQLGSAKWAPAESNLYMEAISDSNVTSLVGHIINEVDELYRDYPVVRVQVIRQWLNNAMALSCKADATNALPPIQDFLFKTKVGGYEQFALAASLLFRSAGVPSRVGVGYVVAVNKDDIPSRVVITDAHAQTWPEVYVEGSGWLPVSLNPTNVLDRPNPPPDPEIEKMLEQKLEPAPVKPAHPEQRSWWSVFLLGLAFLLLSVLVRISYIRLLNVCWANDKDRAVRAMHTALLLTEVAGWSMNKCENYPEFANRVGQKAGNNEFSEALAAIVAKHRECYEKSCGSAWLDWQVPLDVMNRHLGSTYLWRSWRLLRMAFLNARGSKEKFKARGD